MSTLTPDLELDDDAIAALNALCKETRMKPSKAVQAAILAYRRMIVNERYLGTGELENTLQKPSNVLSQLADIAEEFEPSDV
jgi:hypothetical protein